MTIDTPQRYTADITVAVVVEHNGRFLMVEEESQQNIVLNQPAGHIEPGETLSQAARRETLEETGCEVKITHLLSIHHSDVHIPAKSKIRFNFIASLLNQDHSAKLDNGIIAAHWMTLETIKACSKQHRSPMVWRCIEEYLANQSLPLSTIQELDCSAGKAS